MTIHLSPELQALIQQDLEHGAYQSIDEFVEYAVHMLHEQERWFADNRIEIAAEIEAGYASAERGDLLDADEVRARLNEHKQAWPHDQNRQ